jgi:hypothetical protein
MAEVKTVVHVGEPKVPAGSLVDLMGGGVGSGLANTPTVRAKRHKRV